MKYIVNILKKNNKFIAECKELNITAVGNNIVDVKCNFVQSLVLYSKDHNTFIDFTWNILNKSIDN